MNRVLPFCPRDISNLNILDKRPAFDVETGVWLRPLKVSLMGPFVFNLFMGGACGTYG